MLPITPVGITGVSTTIINESEVTEMLITVDTLDFAVPEISIVDLKHILNLDILSFEEGNNFRWNYKKKEFAGGIILAYENDTSIYSCYVSLSGRGCRTYETLQGGEFSWLEFMKLIVNTLHADIRRIDIAVDDYSNLIAVPKLIRYYSQNKFASRCSHVVGSVFSVEEFQVGSPKSEVLVRIYNKALERGFKPGELSHDWYRCEMQMRDTRAKQFVGEWIAGGDLSAIYSGHLLEYMRFLKQPNDKKNSQRIEIADFWLKFCNNAERIPFVSAPGIEYNLSKLTRFLFHQVASSVRTYIALNNLSGEQLLELFDADDIKLNKDQLALLKANRKHIEYIHSKEYREA